MWKEIPGTNGWYEVSDIGEVRSKDIVWIRKVYQPYNNEFGARALARKLDVTHHTILGIVKRKYWKHVP